MDILDNKGAPGSPDNPLLIMGMIETAQPDPQGRPVLMVKINFAYEDGTAGDAWIPRQALDALVHKENTGNWPDWLPQRVPEVIRQRQAA